jgi:hypothetical protein
MKFPNSRETGRLYAADAVYQTPGITRRSLHYKLHKISSSFSNATAVIDRMMEDGQLIDTDGTITLSAEMHAWCADRAESEARRKVNITASRTPPEFKPINLQSRYADVMGKIELRGSVGACGTSVPLHQV